jgi:LmbE family N-acetylglucosaminyl deacetylase
MPAPAALESAWTLPCNGEEPARGRHRRMLAISPHLDDAVFGCGALLATRPDSVVLTVFAGTPRDEQCTDWDRRCGFANARDAMATRRREDDAALALLKARALRLGFLDSQYGDTPSPALLQDALRETLASAAPDRVLVPMGLFHSDHRLVHDATRAALCGARPTRGAGMALWVYEDAPYRALRGLLQQRLAEWAHEGLVATPLPAAHGAPESALKRQAAQAYRSQLRAFGAAGRADIEQPERYWVLERAGAGTAR